MKNNILIVLVLLTLGAGGIWFVYQSGQQTGSNTEKMMGTNTPAPASASADTVTADGVREITIEGTEFEFSVNTLTFKKGQLVRLTFKNTGEMTHDWVVDELDVRTSELEGGSQEVIEFTPDKPGTFEYYCSIGEHRDKGMFGTLTVTE